MFSVQYSVFSFLIVFNTFFLRKPFLPSNSPIRFPLWGLGGCPTILSSCKDLTQKASAFSVQYSVFSFLIVFNTFFLRKPFLPSNSPIHFPFGVGGCPTIFSSCKDLTQKASANLFPFQRLVAFFHFEPPSGARGLSYNLVITQGFHTNLFYHLILQYRSPFGG